MHNFHCENLYSHNSDDVYNAEYVSLTPNPACSAAHAMRLLHVFPWAVVTVSMDLTQKKAQGTHWKRATDFMSREHTR